MKSLSYRLFIRALSNDTRFGIIQLLRKGQRNVSEICSELGLEQSRISHNLKCLNDCGFVVVKTNGKKRTYSLNRDTIVPLLEMMEEHISKYEKHLKSCGMLK